MPTQVFKILKNDFDNFFEKTLPDNDPFWQKVATFIIHEQQAKKVVSSYEEYLSGYLDLYAKHTVTQQSISFLKDIINLMNIEDVLRVINAKCVNDELAKRISSGMITHWEKEITSGMLAKGQRKTALENLNKIKEKCTQGSSTSIEFPREKIGILGWNLYFNFFRTMGAHGTEQLVQWFIERAREAELFMIWMLKIEPDGYEDVIKILKAYNKPYWDNIEQQVPAQLRNKDPQPVVVQPVAAPAPVNVWNIPKPLQVPMSPEERSEIEIEMSYLLNPSKMPKDYLANMMGKTVDFIFRTNSESVEMETEENLIKKTGLAAMRTHKTEPKISSLRFFNEQGEAVSPAEAVLLSTVLTSKEKARFIIGMLMDEPSLAFFMKNNQPTNIFDMSGHLDLFSDFPVNFEQSCMLHILRSKDQAAVEKMSQWFGDGKSSICAELRKDFVQWFFNDCNSEQWMLSLWEMISNPAQVHIGIMALSVLSESQQQLNDFIAWACLKNKSINEVYISNKEYTSDHNVYASQLGYNAINWGLLEKDKTNLTEGLKVAIAKIWLRLQDERIIQVEAALMGGIDRLVLSNGLMISFLAHGCIPMRDLIELQNATKLPLAESFVASALDETDEVSIYVRLKLALLLGASKTTIITVGQTTGKAWPDKAKALLGLEVSSADDRDAFEKEMDYIFDPPMPGDPYFTSFDIKDSSSLDTVDLDRIEKARRIIFLIVTNPHGLFGERAGHRLPFNYQMVLGLLMSDDPKVRKKTIDWLGLECEAGSLEHKFRSDFYPWVVNVGKHAGKKYGLGQKWSKAVWLLMNSDHPSVFAQMLAAFLNKPNDISQLIKSLSVMKDLETDEYFHAITTKLNALNSPHLPVNKAKDTARMICWVCLNEIHRANPANSSRNQWMENAWKLPEDDRVKEIKTMLEVGVSAHEIAVVLGSQYCTDTSIILSDLVHVAKNTKIDFLPFFIQTVWLNEATAPRKLKAAFALGATLSDILFVKRRVDNISVTALNVILAHLDDSSWGAAPINTKLALLRAMSPEMYALHEKKLILGDAFINACRSNIVDSFDVIIKHPRLISRVFSGDLSVENILISDVACHHEVIQLFVHPEYPLVRFFKAYGFLSTLLRESLLDTNGFVQTIVEKLSHENFNLREFVTSYSAFDKGIKTLFFDKKSAFYKKFVSMLIAKMDDNFFLSFKSATDGNQAMLVALCNELEILPQVNKKLKKSDFFMFGLEQNILDSAVVLSIVSGQKNRKDVEAKIKPVQVAIEPAPVDVKEQPVSVVTPPTAPTPPAPKQQVVSVGTHTTAPAVSSAPVTQTSKPAKFQQPPQQAARPEQKPAQKPAQTTTRPAPLPPVKFQQPKPQPKLPVVMQRGVTQPVVIRAQKSQELQHAPVPVVVPAPQVQVNYDQLCLFTRGWPSIFDYRASDRKQDKDFNHLADSIVRKFN